MKVGIISDTHNYFDPQVSRLLQGVDHILHAGDVGSRTIIKQLERIAPVTAVSGNTDDPSLGYKRSEVVELGPKPLRFLVHHIVNPEYLDGTVQDLVRAVKPDVVVFGHTHKAFERQIGTVLFVNSGYAGKQRFNLARSVAILDCATPAPQVRFLQL
jgi:uncharacterized protein